LADREDLRRLLVGHAHPVGVLELLHEGVQIQGVRLQVLLEASLLHDQLGVHVELVGQVDSDQVEHLLAGARGHRWGRLTACADTGERLSAPAAASARWVTATTSSCAPTSARRIACAKPLRVKRPCGTTPRRRRPSRYAPPGVSGSIWARKPPS